MKRHVHEIRSFNRFYTTQLGLLNKHLLQSDYSLVEVRTLFEIGSRKQITSGELSSMLRLDKGYVSRIISTFVQKGLVAGAPSSRDKRLFEIKLSAKGRRLLRKLQEQ